jgi:hypothetical protein
MERLQQFVVTYSWLLPFIIFCALWDITWKLIGMWKAGRNNEPVWFICIALFNTLGILPIIYILMDKKRSESKASKSE